MAGFVDVQVKFKRFYVQASRECLVVVLPKFFGSFGMVLFDVNLSGSFKVQCHIKLLIVDS